MQLWNERGGGSYINNISENFKVEVVFFLKKILCTEWPKTIEKRDKKEPFSNSSPEAILPVPSALTYF